MFGRMPVDLAGVLGLRLSEHAVHAWDIAVALDPSAVVAQDAVELLIDRIPMMIGYTGKQAQAPVSIAVSTTAPERAFTLDTGGVTLAPAGAGDAPTASLSLPAEALLRLVYGRLDDDADLRASGVTLTELKSVFPGFSPAAPAFDRRMRSARQHSGQRETPHGEKTSRRADEARPGSAAGGGSPGPSCSRLRSSIMSRGTQFPPRRSHLGEASMPRTRACSTTRQRHDRER